MNITSQKAKKYDLQVEKYKKMLTGCQKGFSRVGQERAGRK